MCVSSRNNYKIAQLSKNKMNKYMSNLFAIDNSLNYSLECWSDTNFLLDLPEKWILSLFAYLEGNVVGYLICSMKEESVHIHRLAVSNEFQRLEIGSNLIKYLVKQVNLSDNITLKVKKHNKVAIKFYEKNGFIRYSEEGPNLLYKRVIRGLNNGKENTCNECTSR